MFFSRFASQVTMLVRGPSLTISMSQYLIDQIEGTENIAVRTNTQVSEVKGDDRLSSIVLENSATGETSEEPATAIFVFIGATAYTDMLESIVERNEQGFIITGQDLIHDNKIAGDWKLKRQPFMHETNVPGIFAVGDVRNGSVKRVASAVGEGAIAVSMVHQYLKTV